MVKEVNLDYSLEGLMQRNNSLEKILNLRKTEGRRRKGETEDEVVRWHHLLNGHEFEQTPGDGEGQGSLMLQAMVLQSWTQFSN